MERNINRVDVSFTFNQQHLDLTDNRIIFLFFFSMTSHIHFCRSNHSFTPSGEFASKTLLPTSEFTKPSMNTTPLEEKHPQPLLCSPVQNFSTQTLYRHVRPRHVCVRVQIRPFSRSCRLSARARSQNASR